MKNETLNKIFAKLADAVPDKTTGNFHRPDYRGFFDGSGYRLDSPLNDAAWSVGYAKESVIPRTVCGDVFISGSDGRKRRLSDIPVNQYATAAAVDDGSGRGINVFVSINCAGITYADTTAIREKLSECADEKNIVSVSVSASGETGGADTLGVWGDLKAAAGNIPALTSKKTASAARSGINADFMEYLHYAAAKSVKEAVNTMSGGSLGAVRDGGNVYFRFIPFSGGEAVYAAVKDGALRLGGTDKRLGELDFKPVEPLINTSFERFLVPADNRAFLLLSKLGFIKNQKIKVNVSDDSKNAEYHYVTETGIVRLGNGLSFALLPVSAGESRLTDINGLVPGVIPVGLVNDCLSLERFKNSLNGAAAKLKLDAGERTQREINGALKRAVERII